MSRLERLERASLGVGIVCGVLALVASFPSQSLLPRIPASWAWALAPLLLALGVAVGIAAMLRGAEIDRRRWELVEDPYATSGVRKEAHREAERRRHRAGTVFLLGPLLLGFWLSQQLERAGELATLSVVLAPLLGFFAGLLYGRRYDR